MSACPFEKWIQFLLDDDQFLLHFSVYEGRLGRWLQNSLASYLDLRIWRGGKYRYLAPSLRLYQVICLWRPALSAGYRPLRMRCGPWRGRL